MSDLKLEALLEQRRIIRARFTKYSKLAAEACEEAQLKLSIEDRDERETRLSIRKASTCLEPVRKAFTELSVVQETIEFHPDNEERLEKMIPRDDGERKYLDSYAEACAMVQELESSLSTVGSHESVSEAQGFTPEHFAACFKEAMQSVPIAGSPGMTEEQLSSILKTFSQPKRNIEIPKFRGDVDLFDQWKLLVEAELEKPGYSDVEKTRVVLSLLHEDLRKLIETLKEPTADEILEYLETRYGDVLARVERAVNEIAAIPAISNPTLKELDPFYNKLMTNWNYLTKRTDEAMLIQMSWIFTAQVCPKLPKSLVKRWDSERIQKDEADGTVSVLPVTFDVLLRKLRDAVTIARRSAACNPTSSVKKDVPRDNYREKTKPTGYALSIGARELPSDEQLKCIFCDGIHLSIL